MAGPYLMGSCRFGCLHLWLHGSPAIVPPSDSRHSVQHGPCSLLPRYPKGNIASRDQPCSCDAAHLVHVCCMQGLACVSNGLCERTEILNADSFPEYVRGPCTNKVMLESGLPTVPPEGERRCSRRRAANGEV